MLTVRDCMTTTPRVAQATESLADALNTCRRHHIRHLPVVDDAGQLAGMLSERDIMRAASSTLEGNPEAYERLLEQTQVQKAMVKSPVTVSPVDALGDVVKILIEKKFGALPVVEGGRLVGILSQIDVLRVALPLIQKG